VRGLRGRTSTNFDCKPGDRPDSPVQILQYGASRQAQGSDAAFQQEAVAAGVMRRAVAEPVALPVDLHGES
jgi:hypothetical protein